MDGLDPEKWALRKLTRQTRPPWSTSPVTPFHDRYRKTAPFTTPDHFSEIATTRQIEFLQNTVTSPALKKSVKKPNTFEI
jgi:hypothetical protein